MKYFVVAIVILGAGAFLLSLGSKTELSEQTPSPETRNLVSHGPITDGTYTTGTSSSIRWSGRKPLLPNYTDIGTLGIKEGSVKIADGKLAKGRIVFDMNTIGVGSTGKGMGEEMLAKHLRSDDFFSVAAFPTAEMTLTEIALADTGTSSTRHIIKGDLVIKGISHAIGFPADLYAENDRVRIIASTKLDRTRWNIRYNSASIFSGLGDAVIDDLFTVSFDLELLKSL